MSLEMCCPRCFRRFTAPPERAGEQVLEQMFAEQPLYALGDGETFEDMISTTLTGDEPVPCPACGAVLQFSEESLGELALTMLSRM